MSRLESRHNDEGLKKGEGGGDIGPGIVSRLLDPIGLVVESGVDAIERTEQSL